MAKVVSKPAGTVLLKCSCVHPYQDKKHGPGMRAHNICKTKSSGLGARCTVCGHEQDHAPAPISVKTEEK